MDFYRASATALPALFIAVVVGLNYVAAAIPKELRELERSVMVRLMSVFAALLILFTVSEFLLGEMSALNALQRGDSAVRHSRVVNAWAVGFATLPGALILRVAEEVKDIAAKSIILVAIIPGAIIATVIGVHLQQ